MPILLAQSDHSHGRQDPGRNVPVQLLPRQVHHPNRNRDGALSRASPQMASGNAPYGRVKEAHERQANGAHAGHYVQNRLVLVPPHPSVHLLRIEAWVRCCLSVHCPFHADPHSQRARTGAAQIVTAWRPFRRVQSAFRMLASLRRRSLIQLLTRAPLDLSARTMKGPSRLLHA